MAYKWIAAARGVRYREHPTRKHGKRPDRYWTIQYHKKGKTINEAVGWWSQGASQVLAEEILSKLRQNWLLGQGPQTLREFRATNTAAREAEAIAKAADALTLTEFWERTYWPVALNEKKEATINGERRIFRKRIAPALGNKSLKEISANGIEEMLAVMQNEGKAPQTREQTRAVLSGILSMAIKKGLLADPNPCRRVKVARYDNRRTRFLAPHEARKILDLLKVEGPQVHDEALLSLFSGLRAGEIFALTWADVDFENKLILVRDPKNRKNRHAYMTGEVETMLKARYGGQSPSAMVFPGPGGRRRQAMSSIFRRVVGELGLNEGIADRRQKLVFHSLRHTFASWLVQAGEPLYTVKELMGHKSLTMTERYSHLAPDHLRQAADRLEGKLGAVSAEGS